MPRRTLFGISALDRVGEMARPLGSRALVCLSHRLEASAERKRVEESLGEHEVEFSVRVLRGEPPGPVGAPAPGRSRGVRAAARHLPAGLPASRAAGSGEPAVEDIDAAAEQGRAEGCDLVIGLGGGSVLDTAKGAAWVLSNPGSMGDYLEPGAAFPTARPACPLVAIPTTAGTGSEANGTSVLIDDGRGVKTGFVHPSMSPAATLLDPTLTLSVPPAVTAATAMDALSHSLESFVSRAANPLTDACGLEAIYRIGHNIRRAVADGSDVEARASLQWGSYLGGVALNGGLGLAHVLAGPLRVVAGRGAHSWFIAVLLPFAVKLNAAFAAEKYARAAAALGWPPDGRSAEARAETLADELLRLRSDVRLTDSLADVGITRDHYPAILQGVHRRKSGSLKTNPRPVNDDLLVELLDLAL